MLELFGFICACYLLYKYVDSTMPSDEPLAPASKARKPK